MKKIDLKSGMVVEVRDGRKFLVVRRFYCNEFPLVLIGKDRWVDIQDYVDDLTYIGYGLSGKKKNLDIMKVWKTRGPAAFSCLIEWELTEPDWGRSDRKQMTVSEIEKKLGYSVEIIGENNEE